MMCFVTVLGLSKMVAVYKEGSCQMYQYSAVCLHLRCASVLGPDRWRGVGLYKAWQ